MRRQFDYFTDRNKGALVMRLLTKARGAGHLQVLDYRQGWHVYHVSARAIYRLLGDPESQNRRRKGDAQIRAHIIALDYVLENDSDHYLQSEAERVRFFMEDRRIVPETFMGIEGKLHSLLGSFPISLADRTRPAQSSVRFAFIDEGHSTIEKFLRFLSVADPLLRAVGNFEVVYVSLSTFNFPSAKHAFWSHFSSALPSGLRLFDEDTRSVAPQHRVRLQARFTTVLLEHSYPKIQRSEVRGSKQGSHASR
ncbi:MAG: hypothetical protein M3Y50_15700 [Acidobacteriota bacterium]|nr:hypothetical protein [Acidobacteriota bacterium]